MGLILWLAKPTCETCGNRKHTEVKSYTYNVSKMWHTIYPSTKKMCHIDGLTGKESLPLLKAALYVLERYPDNFIAMNPSSGWGSYETFMQYIRDLIELAETHLDWVWESCR